MNKNFKNTDYGIIPTDWKFTELREYLNLLTDYDANGSFADMAKNVNTRFGNGYAWYVRATDLEQNTELSKVRYADYNTYKFLKKSSLLGNEILIAKRGEIGKVYYFKMKTKYATIGPNLYLLKLKENIDSKYLYYYFKSKQGQCALKAINASTSLGAIYKEDVKSLMIPSPKIKEQKEIADILTNIDNLIDLLQKTIEKKEKIFKSATQELLNGQNRISKWKKVKIGNIGEFTGNGVDKKIKEDEQKIRLLNFMDIMHSNFIYKNVSKHFVTASKDKINKCSVKKGDIFLTPSSETRLDIGVSAVAMEDVDDLVYSYHIIRFRPTIEMDLLFRAYIFKNNKFLNQASMMCEGGGKRYVCSNKKFESFELEIPIDIREQNSIANKLYVMEKEINTLKNKLQKYKQIKEGMMEDLLTGKVRLNYE